MSAKTVGKRSPGTKGKQRRAEAKDAVICLSCGDANQTTARFCQGCGRSLTGGGWFDARTMTVLGAACLTLVTIGFLFASIIDTGSTFDESQTVGAPVRTASSAAGQPPDLSTMTPREAADRLFNRVMMADEQGNTAEVAQFAPMAVAAYDQLENLNLDAIYHIGLISAAAGDVDEAWSTVERLRAVVPEHLLASLLEYRLAIEEGDQEKAERAIESFNAAYNQEIIVDRPEYLDHQPQIDLFREQLGTAARDEN